MPHERSTRRTHGSVGRAGFFAGDRWPHWWKRRWVVLECQPLESVAVLSYSHRHSDARAARAWSLAGAQLTLQHGRLRVDLQGSEHRCGESAADYPSPEASRVRSTAALFSLVGHWK